MRRKAALALALHALAPDQPGSLPMSGLCMQHVKHCGVCCRFLDGRVWPQEDEKQVKLMMAMIHHCTGASESPGSAALTTHGCSAPVMHSSCAVSSDDTDSQHLIAYNPINHIICCRCAPEGLVPPQGRSR